ncbi:twin-arginine translocation signal domain-containing protein [Streptomyces sp. NPDC005774]|uniref:twin-arginine translocation signal domain-containing protein n=1 Tax=Streptomyces sp. NPDC005774 TaxID=3364728 RepID=UPI00367DAD15
MSIERRGFLKGAAGGVGTAVVLSAFPAVALTGGGGSAGASGNGLALPVPRDQPARGSGGHDRRERHVTPAPAGVRGHDGHLCQPRDQQLRPCGGLVLRKQVRHRSAEAGADVLPYL